MVAVDRLGAPQHIPAEVGEGFDFGPNGVLRLLSIREDKRANASAAGIGAAGLCPWSKISA
jgi:hypothetical protein